MSLHDRIVALPLVAAYAGRDLEAVELRNHASEIGAEGDARIAELEQCLKEARENLEDWGMYASEYFRDKHGIAEDLAAIDRVLGVGDESSL